MKLIQNTSLFFAIAVGMASFNAVADDHDRDNHGYVKHDEWKKGATIRKEDWGRAEHVDYKEHHLRAPPHGYEWRQVDGNYVLAAVATGVIASAIVASEVH
jgi:Ni/Co efflux regulator RcnB